MCTARESPEQGVVEILDIFCLQKKKKTLPHSKQAGTGDVSSRVWGSNAKKLRKRSGQAQQQRRQENLFQPRRCKNEHYSSRSSKGGLSFEKETHLL